MQLEICELGYCSYADDQELTCDDCLHFVSIEACDFWQEHQFQQALD